MSRSYNARRGSPRNRCGTSAAKKHGILDWYAPRRLVVATRIPDRMAIHESLEAALTPEVAADNLLELTLRWEQYKALRHTATTVRTSG